jgi:nitroreductase
MELREVIESRRSVRRFKDKAVDREMIMEILEAANMAPSATNSQPWSFIVLEKNDLSELLTVTGEAFDERFGSMDRAEVEKKLSRLSIPDEDKYRGLSRFYRTLGGAPVVIFVCVASGGDEYARLLNIASASAAVQNLLLAAWNYGLGTCWMMGPLQKKGDLISKLLSVSAGEEILAIVPVGYPENLPPAPLKEEVETKLRWGF